MGSAINLGGRYGSLNVKKYQDRYEFDNHNYSMYLTLYKIDVADYLSHQDSKRWGMRSSSNSIADEDKKLIKEYLLKHSRKYKTVTDVVKSRSKYKEKILREDFSLNELLEYKEGKEKTNGKIESCS